jgi:hypothetical protein
VSWEGRRPYEISASTLTPAPGSRPFGGLQSGQTFIVAIGYEDPDATPARPFLPLWAAAVEVR